MSGEKQPTIIYLARHGQTWFNTMGRVQGWSDTPLTPAGIEGVEKLGRGLADHHFVSAYSSDSGRARETAQIVLAANKKGKDLRLKERKDIREACFGNFEGDTDENMWTAMAQHVGLETPEEMMAEMNVEGFKKTMNAVSEIDPLGIAEDFPTLQNRLKKAFSEIAEEADQNGGGNVFVVSHGMSIVALTAGLTQDTPIFGVENASITKVYYEAGEFSVKEMGSMDYWK
ncbi:Phosphoglycerate mutase [Carnobacterium maltaromaticum]|uniref:histidine phosphatase family protein n=1 Tax=Carnobacterium maltaromaticum TaxID=2751 RepID=UPI00191BB39E|nr:histidine phosphatase family protein [Carnobacterium maltaromaticum]CAD5901569.1 Phosphoglycerate mutase [Carnobacterium maltaromaticum]